MEGCFRSHEKRYGRETEAALCFHWLTDMHCVLYQWPYACPPSAGGGHGSIRLSPAHSMTSALVKWHDVAMEKAMCR